MCSHPSNPAPADFEFYLEAARQHGEASGPAYEIGDLQAFLFAAWSLLTPDQRAAFARSTAVVTTLDGIPAP